MVSLHEASELSAPCLLCMCRGLHAVSVASSLLPLPSPAAAVSPRASQQRCTPLACGVPTLLLCAHSRGRCCTMLTRSSSSLSTARPRRQTAALSQAKAQAAAAVVPTAHSTSSSRQCGRSLLLCPSATTMPCLFRATQPLPQLLSQLPLPLCLHHSSCSSRMKQLQGTFNNRRSGSSSCTSTTTTTTAAAGGPGRPAVSSRTQQQQQLLSGTRGSSPSQSWPAAASRSCSSYTSSMWDS